MSGGVAVEITRLWKPGNGILSKRIALGEDGRPKPDGSSCRLNFGMAARQRMNGGDPAGAFAAMINAMLPSEALALGRMGADVDLECHIVSSKQRPEFADHLADGLPVITRTHDHFGWPSGPGWALLDRDAKGMPVAVANRIDALGGHDDVLRSLIPGFDSVARVFRASTSSGLYRADTGEQFAGSGGRHDYVLLQDQSDTPRFLKVLHKRAWLAGLGWFMVGAAGQLLERSVVDVSVGSPERLVFEGAPIVVEPLAQDVSQRQAIPSPATGILDSREAVPDLNSSEEAEYERLRGLARSALKPQARAERDRWVATEGAKLGPDGPRLLKAALAKKTLSGGMRLLFDDDALGEVSINDVMVDPERYAGATLADPLDGIDYGAGKARVFVNDDGAIVVNSFAHGGRTFRLLHSANSARTVLDRAGKASAAIYTKVLLSADINAADEDQLLELVRSLTGIGKRPLKADLKKAKAEVARERATERAESDPATGLRRVTKRAPLPDEERTPVVAHIESVLRSQHPPAAYVNVMGEVVRVAQHRSHLLHLFNSDTVDGGVHAEMFAPAPATPLIVPHTSDSAREVVESHIRYLDDSDDGPPRVVTLPEPFIRALLAPRPNSTLPLLAAVTDVPLVMPNGEAIVGSGYHAGCATFFTCSEAEAQAVLPGDLSDDAVRTAYHLLAGEMFADVALQDRAEGMAGLVALLLTSISHPVLAEKPIYVVKAAQRGSGKTTVVAMVVRVITRRSPAAASWSVNEEERRKTLFAVAREGHAILLLDNIPRGATIRDATIERFATSAEIRDRVLGESRTEAVRSPVVVLTGNALQMGGDAGSRTITIELTADRPDPENRPFKHPDILAWIDRNRPEILRAALTILLGNPALRQRDVRIETRFKAWYLLVGSAVEHAAKLAGMPARMVDIFAQSEAADDTVAPLAGLLALLRRAFPGGTFTIDALTAKLNEAVGQDYATLGNQLLDAINAIGRAPMKAVTPRVVGAVLQRNVAGVPIDDAPNGVWVVRPERRRSNRDQVTWSIEEIGSRPECGGSV